MTGFELDPRLLGDTHFVAELVFSKLLLMNDNRWPWLILVPRVAGAVEIHDLEESQRQMLNEETNAVAKALKDITNCKKINTGALGNVVSQLHVHVIARNPQDPNWPAPVWGFGERSPYSDEALAEFSQAILAKIPKSVMG